MLECGAAVAQVTVNHLVAGSNPAIPAIGLVVQLVRTPPCHGGGRGFEPHPSRHYASGSVWHRGTLIRSLK